MVHRRSALTNYGHENIIEYAARPFDSVLTMNETMIANHNERVGPDDSVYIIGDFTLKDYTAARAYAERLNGTLYFLPGSHDHWLPVGLRVGDPPFPLYLPGPGRRYLLPPLYSLEIPSKNGGTRYPLVVVLCHYAMRVWDRSHYGSLHLFGHSHGRLGCNPIRRSLDVGVDCRGFKPISLEEVRAILDQVPAPNSGTRQGPNPDL